MAAIALVTFLSLHIFKVPQEDVRIHSSNLLSLGYFLQAYFDFIVLKDLAIMLSQLICGGYTGFWHAILLHLLTTPIDVIILLFLCIWGSMIFDSDEVEACREAEECRVFLAWTNFVWVMGYFYVCACILLKPLLVGILCFWCGGIAMMADDESEGKEAQIRQLHGSILSGFRSGTFAMLKAE